MTFDEFKAKAQRLELQAFDDSGAWHIYRNGDLPRFASACIIHDPSKCRQVSCEFMGTPVDALARAARLLRPDVVTELRKWLEAEQKEMFSMFEGIDVRDHERALVWSIRAHDMRRAIAKIDELEGK